MGLLRKVAAVLVSLVVLVAILFGVGVLGAPSAGVSDVGDWGEVTEQRTEIVSTVWVDNPNPVGLQLGDARADYRVDMNGVTVATGTKEGVAVSPGNNTIELHTYVQNEKLQPWWVAYVRNDETITVRATGHATVGSPFGDTTVQFPAHEETMLTDETPIIDAISGAASKLEGSYARSVTVAGETVTAGYEVQRAWATWGSVNRSRTQVLVHYRVHNPGDVAVPAVPDGMGMQVSMNDVDMFEGGMDAASPQNVASDAVIEPGETREVVLAVRMDNDKVDDWFRSHVRRGERTAMAVQLQLVFESDTLGETFRLPADGPSTFECDLRTAMLVDDQTTDTDCGAGP